MIFHNGSIHNDFEQKNHVQILWTSHSRWFCYAYMDLLLHRWVFALWRPYVDVTMVVFPVCPKYKKIK
jgi:hypothetical protein